MITLLVIIYVLFWCGFSAAIYNEEKRKHGYVEKDHRLSYFFTGLFWPIWIILGIPYAIFAWLSGEFKNDNTLD